MIQDSIDYAIEMSVWYEAQSDHKQASRVDYRAGWYLCAIGRSIDWCVTEAMVGGWLASFDADRAMRKIEVRG